VWDITEEVFLCCGIHRKRFFPVWDTPEEIFSSVGYNGIGFPPVCDHHRTISGCFLTNYLLLYPTKQKSFPHCILHWNSFSSVASHSAKESSEMYPTTQKVLSVVGYSAENLYKDK
jgi:hypothetical protein